MLYINPTVTTDQKPIINTHKKREMNPNIALKIVIKTEGKRVKKKQKELQVNLRIINKMAVSTYLSVITLTVNNLNASIKKHRKAEMNGEKKTRTIYMLSTTDSLQI